MDKQKIELVRNSRQKHIERLRQEETLARQPEADNRRPSADTSRNTNLAAIRSTPPKKPPSNENIHGSEEQTESISPRRGRVRTAFRALRSPQKNSKLPTGVVLLMLALALFFDALQLLLNFIPFVGNIVSMIVGLYAWLSFYIWFKCRGVNFVRPKRILTLWGAGFIEFLPILNILPAWTLAVILLVLNVRLEEKTGLSLLAITKRAKAA